MFDVIFSADDAINFLETFTQWKSTFQSVNDHLSGDGLFIFDIYTPKMLTSEKGKGPTFRRISKGYYYDKGVVSKNALIWKVKIFEHVRDKLYEINEYEFKETIYPIPKVRRALHKYFDILESKPREEGRKILFVCRKK